MLFLNLRHYGEAQPLTLKPVIWGSPIPNMCRPLQGEFVCSFGYQTAVLNWWPPCVSNHVLQNVAHILLTSPIDVNPIESTMLSTRRRDVFTPYERILRHVMSLRSASCSPFTGFPSIRYNSGLAYIIVRNIRNVYYTQYNMIKYNIHSVTFTRQN